MLCHVDALIFAHRARRYDVLRALIPTVHADAKTGLVFHINGRRNPCREEGINGP